MGKMKPGICPGFRWWLVYVSLCLYCVEAGDRFTGSFQWTKSANDKPAFKCSSGCMHPNMSVEYLLTGRKISGTQHISDENLLIPLWINRTLFSLGQQFAVKNLGYLGMSHLFALIFDNALHDVNAVLLATGSTSNPEVAAKRYTATAVQVGLWYANSLDIPEQRQILMRSLQTVREIHLKIAFRTQQSFNNVTFFYSHRQLSLAKMSSQPKSIFNDYGFWSAVISDLQNSKIPPEQRVYPEYKYNGIPISQFNQVLTQFSFVGMVIVFRKQLGIFQATEEELRGLIHIWGVFGHVLGVADEYNICMQADLQTSENLYREMLQKIFIPALFQMDETAHIQVSGYLDGLNVMDANISPRMMMYRFLRDIVQVNPVKLYQQLNILEKMFVAGLDGVMSDNGKSNQFFLNRNGNFFLDVNGYKYFGRKYRTHDSISKGVYYIRGE